MNISSFLRRMLLAILWAAAMPAQAASAPPPLDAYGDLPGIEDMAISPSGKGLAVAGRLEGQRQLVVLDGERKIRGVAPLGDAKLRYIQWAGEDTVVVVISSTENLGFGFTTSIHEFSGAIILTLGGAKPQSVFGKTPSMARAIFGNYGTRLIGGKWTGYFGGVEFRKSAGGMGYEFDHGRPGLFAVDLKENKPKQLAKPAAEGHWRSWLVDGDGKLAAILDTSSQSGRWQLTNGQGATLASGVDPTGDVHLVGLGREGTSVIYALEDAAAEQKRWYEVPLAGGTPAEVFAGIDIERIYSDPTNGRLLGYLEGGGRAKPVLFDSAQQATVRKVYRAFPKLDLNIVEWTPNMSHFLVKTSGNGDSGTWYIVDIAKRTADPVGDERPLIATEQVGAISTVDYKADDGMELDGILTLPPGREAKKLPVIVFPHGGPQSQDKERFDWWAQAFASRGYAVFQPNFRGSTNRDHAFVRAGFGQWGRKMQTDVSDGLAELVRLGIADPKRACIMGASYGGYAALAGVTLQQGLYRCAVSVAGVSDLSQMYHTENRESGGDKMVRRSLKESLGDPKTFNEVSPRRSAARADAPILLIHGKDDTVVAFQQSDSMADALRSNGKPYKFVTLKEEDHWLSRPATRKQMLEEAMSFVQQNNPAE